jgi:hypothetical protein
MRTAMFRGLALAALLAALAAADRAAADKDEGFTPLFNGKDLAGLKFLLPNDADPAKTWSVHDGVLVCNGKPNGYFYTEKSYRNYVLRYDWRYIKPPEGQRSTYNSGVLVHIQNHKIWPKCVEVQGAHGNHGVLYFLDCKKIEAKYDQATKNKVTKPIGEWNTTEIICKGDGTIIAKINGTEVTQGKSDLTEGPIGWQSEGAEIHFRHIMIKEQK